MSVVAGSRRVGWVTYLFAFRTMLSAIYVLRKLYNCNAVDSFSLAPPPLDASILASIYRFTSISDAAGKEEALGADRRNNVAWMCDGRGALSGWLLCVCEREIPEELPGSHDIYRLPRVSRARPVQAGMKEIE